MKVLAKIIADSVSPAGARLTTMEVVVPRIVLAEFNTHRALSRNSASSRAIPIEKMLQRVIDDPYVPETWGRNGKGMQAHGDFTDAAEIAERNAWYLESRDLAVAQARKGDALGIHKQTVNRLIEPFMWHTIIVTATEWSNFFNLRNNEKAHPAIARTAAAMLVVFAESKPAPVDYGEWHLPYINIYDRAELSQVEQVKVSCARCARVSYLTHDGKRDVSKDLALYDDLLGPGHMSPFEHAATPLDGDDADEILDMLPGVHECDADDVDAAELFVGNFRGWVQHRKQIKGEADILGYKK